MRTVSSLVAIVLAIVVALISMQCNDKLIESEICNHLCAAFNRLTMVPPLQQPDQLSISGGDVSPIAPGQTSQLGTECLSSPYGESVFLNPTKTSLCYGGQYAL